MSLDPATLAHLGLTPAGLDDLLDRHEAATRPRLALLWNYYRNPMRPAHAGRRARLAQERGLPARLTGRATPDALARDDRAPNREIVVENDIAWRLQTMVDFMFGRPITIVSTARDPALRQTIGRILDSVFESSGGAALLSDIGLLGHVYGHIDLLVRAEPGPVEHPPRDLDETLALASRIRIEPIEPTRGIPIIDPADYRRLLGYIVQTELCADTTESPGAPSRLSRWLTRTVAPASTQRHDTLTEIITPARRTTYTRRAAGGPFRLVDAGPSLVTEDDSGPVPIVHIQNISQPFHYAGLSEVEPLIPLQDELNTRLSDRASRVTMQSFKMYLAKGLDGFDRVPIGPNQVWATDNPDASVEAFGGDGASPSEESHITEVREAMDKASGVPPLASGVVRAKIGNLTSENALRITLMGLLSKTARKRVTYGRGLARVCELILLALDRAGILATDPSDRTVRVEWPDPLPRDEREALDAAQRKLDLGIPRERILAELGYAPTDPGIV